MDGHTIYNPKQIINLYEEGRVSTHEFMFALIQTLTPESTEVFAREVRLPVLNYLLDAIGKSPTTDEEWEQLKERRTWNWTGDSAASGNQDKEAAFGRYRRGVELFRAFHRCLFPAYAVCADARWLTSTVRDLTRSMHANSDFSAMPILADALQEAGCDNNDILDHCRQQGEHVHGCWVVDLILEKPKAMTDLDPFSLLAWLGGNPRSGVYLRPPCDEATLEHLQTAARRDLDEEVPQSFLRLLRITNGVQINGAYFKEAEILVPENLDLSWPEVIVLGTEGNMVQYVFDRRDREYHTINMGFPDERFASFTTFDAMLLAVLQEQQVI